MRKQNKMNDRGKGRTTTQHDKNKLTKKHQKYLNAIYHDPKRGFKGVQELSQVSKLPQKTVKEFLKTSRAYTLHAPARKRYERRPIVIDSQMYGQVEADLVDLSKLSKAMIIINSY